MLYSSVFCMKAFVFVCVCLREHRRHNGYDLVSPSGFYKISVKVSTSQTVDFGVLLSIPGCQEFACSNMDGPRDIILSEENQKEKDKHHMISLTCGI